MEEDAVGVDLRFGGGGDDFGRLSRREADDGALLIVVGLAAVPDVAGLLQFEEQGVDAVVPAGVFDASGGLVQVDDADQRVEGFEPVEAVVLIDRIQIDGPGIHRCFHPACCLPLQRYAGMAGFR